jgi:hypothetical protein
MRVVLFFAVILSSLCLASSRDVVVEGKDKGTILGMVNCEYTEYISLGSSLHPYTLYRVKGDVLENAPSKVEAEENEYFVVYSERLVFKTACQPITLRLVE